MRYLTQTIRSLGVTFRNLFRAPTTEYFGRPEHDKGERFRTSFALLYEDQVRNEAGDLEPGRGDELCIDECCGGGNDCITARSNPTGLIRWEHSLGRSPGRGARS